MLSSNEALKELKLLAGKFGDREFSPTLAFHFHSERFGIVGSLRDR